MFLVAGERFEERLELPEALPAHGFLWLGYARSAFEQQHGQVQAALQRYGMAPLVDLHLSDLINAQLPSHFDDTSWYDLLVFRRLVAGPSHAAAAGSAAAAGLAAATAGGSERSGAADKAPAPAAVSAASARLALAAIDTNPVGFAVFDRVLITVHPDDCTVREFFVHRWTTMAHAGGGDLRGSSRLPTSPAEQMLRMANYIVDSYLELRRLLSRQLGTLQQQLLDPRQRFADWPMLLESRNALHLLEDTCEDQRAAVQEWIDALDEWPAEDEPVRRRERELLRVRSRDLLEHIERVLAHVRRLEQGAETAVQMHFSALSHRTNDIMRTLTVLTAIFLPLNLLTGFFGMNFEFMPLIHTHTGFWVAVALMLVIGVGLAWFFRRKRYLGTLHR
ncbi:MAG: magnesium transporter CorA family protein [Rubrivivax sp.]|nr:magnesium transporter CorA family protein [Rubrivivax sp.]